MSPFRRWRLVSRRPTVPSGCFSTCRDRNRRVLADACSLIGMPVREGYGRKPGTLLDGPGLRSGTGRQYRDMKKRASMSRASPKPLFRKKRVLA
jgi:hypothetical protein